MVLIGYDLPKEQFLAKNSFGTKWGKDGYCWIPFEYIRTNAFEKWCFDISDQSTTELNEPTVEISSGSV